ncbi:hypothetical protein ABMA27_012330 [Loxostege sticticalis]|uniref:C2H2-type domain-containing protein n=1 Tax=Loxostege sticticalis TaxID=481309 RepID=A0ABR3H0X9_LOXSC
MSSFLCFICHSTVNEDTNEDMREKYREVVGMNLCPDSHLCHICCHVLNRLWLFRSVCLKRSLEYPVLFSEKGTLNLQRNDLEIHTVCFEDCEHYKNRNINSKYYHFKFFDDTSDSNEEYPSYPNEYVKLEDDRNTFEEIKDKQNYQEAIHNDAEPEYSQDFSEESTLEATNIDVEPSEEDYQEIADSQQEDDETDVNFDNLDECKSPKIENVEEKFEETETEKCEKKKNKSKKEKQLFEKFKLSVSEQKAELERNRKEKKYIEAEFKCYNCALGFLFKDTHQAHMMRHEESNGEYRCGICTLRFATPAVLRAHTSIHAERHKCTHCGEVVRPRHRVSHARACRNLPAESVACHLCGNMFNGPNALQQHLKRFHRSKSTGRTYACSVCGERYNDQAAVRTHMIKHIQRKFHCDECSSTFSSPYTLRQHKKKHEAPQLLRKKPPRQPQEMASFDCPICGRVCPTQRSLASHIATVHSTSKDYACALCPARYTTRKSLVRHAKRHEGRVETVKAVCHHCGSSFKGNNKLNRHLRQVCEKEKWEEELSTYCQ